MTTYPQLVEGVIGLAKEARLTAVAQALAVQTIPPPSATPQSWQHYAAALLGLLQERDLGREWQFSAEQIKKLNRYFAANELLVHCLKVATVTDRQAILNGVLKPPAVRAKDKPVAEKRGQKTGKPWWKVW